MNVANRIRQTLSAWPGVSEAPHRFGGIEFRYGGKELGHLHEDRLADLPFSRSVHDQLVANGEAEPHHIYPDSGWVSVWIRKEEDVDRVIRLFRMQYDRLVKKSASRNKRTDLVYRKQISHHESGGSFRAPEHR